MCRCILQSLALRYREVFQLLLKFAPFPLEKLNVIGGGSQNIKLSQYTCNAVGVPVITGPVEGTALGNVMLQAKADGLVKDIHEMRKMIANSIDIHHYTPEDGKLWDYGYEIYKRVCANEKNL